MIFFESHQISIIRRRRIGSTDRYSLSSTFTVYGSDVQPASPERVQDSDGRFGALYSAFVDPGVNVKAGDQIRTDGKTYGVRGVQTWTGAGLLDHKELLLESKDG